MSEPPEDDRSDQPEAEDGSAPATASAPDAESADEAGAAAPGGPEDATTDTKRRRRTGRKRGRVRSILVGVLVVLTSLTVVVSTVTVWVHQTVFNTDKWLEVVGPLPKDPAFANAVSTFVTAQVGEAVDLRAQIREALPDQLDPLVDPVLDRVRARLETALGAFIASDAFHGVWVNVNRKAHEAAVRVLRGESDRLAVGPEGEVRLNLVPLVYRALGFIQDHLSFLLRDHQVPTGVDPVSDPAGAVAALSTEFGRPLPADFAQPVVFTSSSLAAAQTAVHVFDVVFYVALVLPLVLIAVTLLLSRRRRRTTIQLAVGAFLALLLAQAIVRKLQDYVATKVTNPSYRPAVSNTVSAVFHGLQVLIVVLLIVGALVAVAAYLAGRPRWLVRVGAGMRRASTSPRAERMRMYVAGHATAFRWGAISVAIVVVWIAGLSWLSIAIVGGLLALTLVGIELLRRRYPDAGPELEDEEPEDEPAGRTPAGQPA